MAATHRQRHDATTPSCGAPNKVCFGVSGEFPTGKSDWTLHFSADLPPTHAGSPHARPQAGGGFQTQPEIDRLEPVPLARVHTRVQDRAESHFREAVIVTHPDPKYSRARGARQSQAFLPREESFLVRGNTPPSGKWRHYKATTCP